MKYFPKIYGGNFQNSYGKFPILENIRQNIWLKVPQLFWKIPQKYMYGVSSNFAGLCNFKYRK